MSFGLNEGDVNIKSAISKAYSKEVILFAAASNDGARRGITYPAKYPLVYCINACDGDGHPAPFNPPFRSDNTNFCILGMGVQSIWPKFENLDPASRRKKGSSISQSGPFKGTMTKHMSGTSVATPFAAALLAVVCSYERGNTPLIGSSHTVKSYEGTKKLLKGMSKKIDDKDIFDVIIPWEGRGRRFKDYRRGHDFAKALYASLAEEY
jgi:hypothetical protein